ncbi:hypothetical protein LJR034_009203 [Caballeronia sp. LjRoot34]|uniref:hypothetical protein n=1 Tax=Caballeronia sp. LjRoot34 TaxID=3342325 RepID=UPI003ECFF133
MHVINPLPFIAFEATQKVVDISPVGKKPRHLMKTPDNQALIVANSVSDNLGFP